MEVLAHTRAGGRYIHCGVTTTTWKRGAVQPQRFRVYQRRSYYRPGLNTDRDERDTTAVYSSAPCASGPAWPAIKLRFLRALQGAGVCLREIHPARLIYPVDRMASGDYQRHPDPVIPVYYWRAEDIGPSVDKAIAGHRGAEG